ncbi:hypothetical protein B9G98_03814 [Wickerhamiella sorbophila]|uniref:Nitrogen regulatory protein areA GATA-like domain-containing protein n=1 Tax=Wickerhamiella sorbophila TaxID=45607 RepID=A0A2T0FMH8_9ASCO|nr:hypothetical protein B9G98_03814 [Wickerhamiella sorbophila]PRT56194.1 hypothetical protein B9G98_03814 [Wickerhamiella sorbophila]
MASHRMLRLCNDALDSVNPDDVDDVRSIWAALSKAKDAIEDGKRLEYLSWRLYSQKVLPRTMLAAPLSEETVKSPRLRESTSTASFSSPPMLDASSSSESIESCRTRPNSSIKRLSQLFQPPQEKLELAQLHTPENIPKIKAPLPRVPSAASIAYSRSVLNMASSHTPTPQQVSGSTNTPLKIQDSASDSGRSELARSVNFQETPSSYVQQRGRSSEPDMAQSATRAVRGFSPSNISVAINYSSQSLAAQSNSSLKRNNSGQSSPSLHKEEGSSKLGWSKASIPRGRMFFIESSTDSEVGSASSVESILNDDQKLSSSQRSSRSHKVTFAHVSGDEESEGSIHYYHTDDDYEDEADDSEWDDLDEEEDETVDPQAVEELSFDEREVPMRPAVTRSHLSSLFLKKLQNADTPVESPTNSPKNEVAVPANILLNAQVANHYPLQNGTNNQALAEESEDYFGNVDEQELSQSVRDNLKMSRDYDLQSLWAVKRSSGSRSRSCSSSNSLRNSQSWLQSSEDIFDPLNYHSRGW